MQQLRLRVSCGTLCDLDHPPAWLVAAPKAKWSRNVELAVMIGYGSKIDAEIAMRWLLEESGVDWSLPVDALAEICDANREHWKKQIAPLLRW